MQPNSFSCQDLAYSSGNGLMGLCTEGCVCPGDMKMNFEGGCVSKQDCGCAFEGKVYAANSVLPQPGGTYKVCASGAWLTRMKRFSPPACGRNMIWSPCLSETEPTCENMHNLATDNLHCKQGGQVFKNLQIPFPI